MKMSNLTFAAVVLIASVSLALAQGTYTQIDYPGAVWTGLSGIDSAGDIVGWYGDTAGNYHGFLLSGGVYTAIDVSGASGTYAQGINDRGQIVGYSLDSVQLEGFLYDAQSHTFTTIDFPGSTSTYARGINNAGVVVGYAFITQDNKSFPVGFEYAVGGLQESATTRLVSVRAVWHK